MGKQNPGVQITSGAGGPCITKGADKLTDHSSLQGVAPSRGALCYSYSMHPSPQRSAPSQQVASFTKSLGNTGVGEEKGAGFPRNARAHG